MYRTIVVPIDLSHPELGRRTLATAREIGGAACRVVAVHVAEGVPPFVAEELPKEPLRQGLAAAQAALEALSGEFEAEAVVRRGYPPRQIVELAESIGADLIVVDSHRYEPEDFLFGAPAVRIVRHARCPVLVCPSAAEAQRPSA